MNNKSCAANDKNIAVSKETEFLKKYWNHVSEKASGHILGLCKNYFFCLFYLWSTLEWFFLPRLSQFTAHCQSLHNHSSHTRCLLWSGVCKSAKGAENVGFLSWLHSPASCLSPLRSSWKGGRVCRAEGEDEAGKQRKAGSWKVWQQHSLGKGCPQGFGMTKFWASGGERVCVKSEWRAVCGTWEKWNCLSC